MKHTQKKILDALCVISDTCKDTRSCELCPLRGDKDKCYINEVPPHDWNILNEDHSWRAFR